MKLVLHAHLESLKALDQISKSQSASHHRIINSKKMNSFLHPIGTTNVGLYSTPKAYKKLWCATGYAKSLQYTTNAFPAYKQPAYVNGSYVLSN